jgi:ADP-ribosyl-[dinitrogen reductase] hydrolase
MDQEVDRYVGCLVGLAVGDALGAPLEFRPKDSFEPITDMIGGGPFGLEPGQWTDDTSMALCLAESIVARQSIDPADQMQRYLRWWREGYRSSRPGHCFDIGNTVSAALRRFERTGDANAGSADRWAAGNGSLMRLAPVPMFYCNRPSEAVVSSSQSSRTTHAAREAIDACRYFAALLVGALRGAPKETLTSELFAPEGVDWIRHPLSPQVQAIAAGSYKTRDASAVRASGYVVHTLEAALWAFHRSATFEEGALLAVNLGEDADTTGAVFGQLAGAHYGYSGIPQRWLELLYDRESIEDIARQIHASAVDRDGDRRSRCRR